MASREPRGVAPASVAPWVAALAGGVFAAALGPMLQADSTSYVEAWSVRPPLYPLFLAAFRLAFGAVAGLRAVVFVQGVIGVLAVWRLLKQVDGVARLPTLAWAAFGALFLSFQLYQAPTVLSESLCLSAFLVGFAEALRALESGLGRRETLSAGLAMAACVLIRSQFLFLVPLFVAGVAAAVWRNRTRPGNVAFVAGAVVILAITLGGQYPYNYVKTGRMAGVAATGEQLLTPALYLSSPDDVDAFSEPDDRAYVRRLLDDMASRQLLWTQRPGGMSSAVWFGRCYNEICHQVIEADFPSQPGDDDLTVAAARDRVTLRVARTLIARHPFAFAKHYLGLVLFAYWYFLLFLLGLAAYTAPRARRDALSAAGLLAVALWCANMGLVCLVEIPIWRYTFYTDTLVVAMAGALVWRTTPMGSRGGST